MTFVGLLVTIEISDPSRSEVSGYKLFLWNCQRRNVGVVEDMFVGIKKKWVFSGVLRTYTLNLVVEYVLNNRLYFWVTQIRRAVSFNFVVARAFPLESEFRPQLLKTAFSYQEVPN